MDPVLSLSLDAPGDSGPRFSGTWLGGPENRTAAYLATQILAAEGSAARGSQLPSTLVVFGPHGSGKSLYLRLLAHALRRQDTAMGVEFPSAEEWSRQGSSPGRMPVGPKVHGPRATLILDDIHRLADRPAAQRMLVDRIDTEEHPLHLIVSCLDPPWLTRLQPRLTSRLCSGLSLRLSLPGSHVRHLRLQQLQQHFSVSLSADAVRWLVHHFRGSLDDLTEVVQGCQRARYSHGTISLSRIKEIAGGTAPPSQLSPTWILAAIGREFGVSQKELVGHSRRRTLVIARAVAMYALRRLTDWSLETIGEVLGKRDHSTVLNALRRVDQLLEEDPSLRTRVDSLLQAPAPPVARSSRKTIPKEHGKKAREK